MRDRYRIEYSTVYEYSAANKGYVCIGNKLNYTKSQLREMSKEQCDDTNEIAWEEDLEEIR